MTERSTTSPNRIAPYEINGVPSYLQMGSIEDLRYKQQVALHEALMNSDDWQNFGDDDERAISEELVEKHLVNAGIAEDDEHYDEAKAFLMGVSAHEVSDYTWHNSRDEDGNYVPSRRHTVYDELENSYKWDAPDTDPHANPDDPGLDGEVSPEDIERNELIGKLNLARDKWSTVSAKRQGRIASIGIKNRKKIEADYFKAVQNYVGFELHDLLEDPDETVEFKKVAIMQHLFYEQEMLRDHTREKLKDTKINKFVEFMNRGNVATKIAKGLGVGALAGLTGVIAGGVLVSGVAAGTVIAASRFARGYVVGSDMNEIGTKKFEDVVDADELDARYSANDEHDDLAISMDYVDDTFEADTMREQRKRRLAFAMGATAVGVGAALSYGLTHLGEIREGIGHIGNFIGDRIDGIGDWINGDGASVDAGTDSQTPDTGSAGGHPAPDIDHQPDADHSDLVGEAGDNSYELNVEAGSSYTSELMQFAEANGQKLTPAQAYDLHTMLVNEFGADYIDIDGAGRDIYTHAGDIRLVEPGVARWEAGVPEFTMNWMNDNGLWTSASK